MNTGIQDAHNLGWKLVAVAKGASPELLDTYNAERRPVASDVLALSNARLKQAIEQNRIPTRSDANTLQLSVGYRGSDLVHDDRGETAMLRAGDRAPDATGLTMMDGEHRLFDLMRDGHFTLLSFGAKSAVEVTSPFVLRTLYLVEQPVGPDDIADTDGHLSNAYGSTDRTLVLIRPDGYIALIYDAGDVSVVSNYLAAIG